MNNIKTYISIWCIMFAGLLTAQTYTFEDPCNNYGNPFYLGCITDWISTHGTPNTRDINDDRYANMLVKWAGFYCEDDNPDRGEGIALHYNFDEGDTYEIKYTIRWRLSKPLRTDWVLTSGLPNQSAPLGANPFCDETDNITPSIPSGSQIISVPNYTDEWQEITSTFTANDDYSQLWFRPANTMPLPQGLGVEKTSRVFLDNVSITNLCDNVPAPDFEVLTACDNGSWCTMALTYTGNSNLEYEWYLMEIKDYYNPNDTSDANTADADNDPNDSYGILTPAGLIVGQDYAIFCGLDISKKYYIKYRVREVNGCMRWQESRLPVPNAGEGKSEFHLEDENGLPESTFCIGEDIYLDGRDSLNENNYSISVWRRPIGSLPAGSMDPDDYNWFGGPGWAIPASPADNIINLTDLFGNLSQPPYNQGSDKVFHAGYEYLVQFAIANLPECVPWTRSLKKFTVDVCCSLPAPTRLHQDFDLDQYNWNPISGAIGYEVEFNINIYTLCCWGGPTIPQTLTFVVDSPYISFDDVNLPPSFKDGTWRVRTLCDEGLYSSWSEPKLILHEIGPGPGGRLKGEENVLNTDMDELSVSISPNPNNGNMQITIEKESNTPVTMEVYRFDGLLVDTIHKPSSEEQLNFGYNAIGKLATGLYFFKFVTAKDSIIKRVVVK